MLISTKHLKAAGCNVRVTANGVKSDADMTVEISFDQGRRLSNEIANELDDLLGPEFGPAAFEALAHKVHGLQVLEAIRKTENKAWRERK